MNNIVCCSIVCYASVWSWLFLNGKGSFFWCPVISSAILEGFAALDSKLMFALLSARFPVFICDSSLC